MWTVTNDLAHQQIDVLLPTILGTIWYTDLQMWCGKELPQGLGQTKQMTQQNCNRGKSEINTVQNANSKT